MNWRWFLFLLFLSAQTSVLAENDHIFSDSLESTRVLEVYVDTVIQNGESVVSNGVALTAKEESPSSVEISSAINKYMEPVIRVVVSGGNVTIDLNGLLNPSSNALMAGASATACLRIDENYPLDMCVDHWPSIFASRIQWGIGRINIENVRIPNDGTTLNELYLDGIEREYEFYRRDGSRLYSSTCSVWSTCYGEPVLLIHGFQREKDGTEIEDNGGAQYWGSFPQRLISDGYNPYAFIWLSNARFEDVAADLSKAIARIKTETGKNVHIVAHSFGGVLTRRMLQDTNLNPVGSSIASVTTIGSPHNGIFGGENDYFGIDFPKGQDNVIFKFCDQISCHLMGKSVLEPDIASLLQVGIAPGTEAYFLAATTHRLPSLNIQNLIGFQKEGELLNDQATAGDGLISGKGQRFHPDLVFTADSIPKWDGPLYKFSMGDALITEYILGRHSTNDADLFLEPYKVAIPADFVGFKHSAGTVKFSEWSYDENEPFVSLAGFHDVYQRVVDWIALNTPVYITNFSASPSTITAGESTTISWTTENSESCTPSGGTGGWDTLNVSLPNGNASITIATAGTFTFTLTCEGSSGPVTRSITVPVMPPDVVTITSFSASPSTIATGESTTISWETQNAESCTPSGGVGDWVNLPIQLPNGSSGVSITAAGSYTFTLTCADSSGSVNRSITVTVTPPDDVAITSFNASPSTITAGGSTTISWTTENAESCAPSAGTGGWDTFNVGLPNGNAIITIATEGTYTFLLTCQGLSGPVAGNTTVIVTPPDVVAITSFNASPSTITAGESTTISWTTQNAESCAPSQGVGGWNATSIQLPNGSAGITIATAGTYTFLLTCQGLSGPVAGNTTVIVTPPDVVAITSMNASPSTITVGESTTISWTTQNAESCIPSGGTGGWDTLNVALPNGNATIAIATPDTYMFLLTCLGLDGPVTRAAYVLVLDSSDDDQKNALTALYNSTDGDNWIANDNWLVGDPCLNNWFGVTCDGNLKIQRISMDHNNLVGTIPPELGDLTKLEYLSLISNLLTGSIPAELGNLVNLKKIWLRDNQLTGSIPVELGNLTNLSNLNLIKNQLTGSIPVELSNLINLSSLFLDNNQLTGNIPVELGSLINLTALFLNNNQLSGSIPVELGNLINLHFLTLDDNQLTGNIPVELGNLGDLQELYLNSNLLTGSIPVELGNLANLEFFSLTSNQLTGNIPNELGNLVSLKKMWLWDNQLTGTIPVELSNLANLRLLYLNSNQLTGSIPVELGNLANLEFLDLRWNGLYTLDSALDTFLDTISNENWSITQTIQPANVTIGSTTNQSVTLSWDAIEYIGDSGRYRVLHSTVPGGPYTDGGSTANKSTPSLGVTGLSPATTYYFIVRTETDSHANNQNSIVSDPSEELSATTQ